MFAKEGHATGRDFGFLTAGAFFGSKALNKLRIEKEERASKSNEWLGTVGERQVFTLKFVSMRELDSHFGESWLVTFEDDKGNAVKWFSSRNPGDLKEGLEYQVKGTVKKHDDYKGRRQTLLSRCKLQA